jgi:capsular exopolysaccharide synthesis family protein
MEEREIHLRDYLKTLYKRKYTVLTFFVIVFVVVLIGALSTTPVYEATTKVLIEKIELYNMSMASGGGPYFMPYDPEFYDTQLHLIKSTAVAQKVVNKLSLENAYESYFKDSKKNFPKDKPKTDILAEIIRNGIVVTPVKNTKIVNISYLSTNPEFAVLVANSVAEAYIEEMLEMRMSFSRHAIAWMTEKAEGEKTKLEKSEKSLQEYMRFHDIVTIQDKIALTPEKLTALNEQLISAEAKRKELELRYSQIMKVNPKDADTIPAIASDPTFQSLRNQIMNAEQNIQELSKKYGKKHPSMIKAEEELKNLIHKKNQEISRIIASIKNEYELARANEVNLRGAMSSTKTEAINLNEKYIQYGVLARESETNKQLYDALMKGVKEQSLTGELQNIRIWVVEKAKKPGSPVKPRKMLNVLLGIMVGLFGGGGLAFFFEYLDNTIKSPEEIESRLGQSVLGVVPLFEPKEGDIEQIIMNEPQAVIAENYKSIRTAILLSSANKPPQNLLITSMGPEEGKTVTSTNLAITIAQSEYTVLLVDSDLRKPRIHKIFGIENTKGLSTYLAGASPDINISSGPIKNLSILPSGPLPPNPSELLGSNKMYQLMKALNEKFDIIIWDSPPLMTVTDSFILSRILDGTIIVTRAGKTTYEIVRRGLRSLKGRREGDIQSHVLGIVINALDLKKSDYYYYRYYNYYYSSQAESKQ